MKSLILLTNQQAKCLFQGDIYQNVLWGLALQFGWQRLTGRLLTTNISLTPDSWWADMNYQLMIIPLLGASGILPGVPDVWVDIPPNIKGPFCRNSTGKTSDCQPVKQALEDWSNFFKLMQTIEKNCSLGLVNQSDAVDQLVSVMWLAHTSSLKSGLPLFSDKLKFVSKEEGSFGAGWASLVEFIAAVRFVTNFNNTSEQQSLLPQRMLVTGDKPGHITDMSPATNFGIEMVENLNALNANSNGVVLSLWKKAMCSQEGRIEGRYLLENGLKNPALFIPGMLKLIYDGTFRPCN